MVHAATNTLGPRFPAARLEREPALGAHLKSSRVVYSHHGVYIGGGKVVHYAGFCRRWWPGPVEEVTLTRFAVGHTIRIVDHITRTYSPQEIVDRARSRVGERNYRLLTNNCEHFCNWCVSGYSRSAQAERPMQALRALAHRTRAGRCLLATLSPARLVRALRQTLTTAIRSGGLVAPHRASRSVEGRWSCAGSAQN
jgi:Lecithin retinol acyltransferase